MSVDEKINILFYLFGVFLVFFIFAFGLNIKRSLFPKILDKFATRISDWDSSGDQRAILDNVDRYIEKFPGESSFQWAKARALYKTGKLEEAKSTFEDISKSEPMWKEDSDKYIQSINEQLSI
ncbi:hypothetical protein GCM10008107_24350 [Psychrosphaera saromensis]|uniref:Tetratricopeptide repeat protein n=1 Tax=Psychrosphaera saromensis TaxID=716813 RepID=A0A2S7UXX7_9GAMM|nr:hypothetical protein [Psychrosphaera saromensis]PQJ54342.1 hypothetical protein BTO11_12200 [Psychrosphaera saromensis]GHB74137.1 hypothetical protein GCM10008107_24350 [Psychrosphaera saromensis]GLQ12548.1 hypothetical protein GCM10007917_00030 [Psychrosphaera saromensis]